MEGKCHGKSRNCLREITSNVPPTWAGAAAQRNPDGELALSNTHIILLKGTRHEYCTSFDFV